MPGPPSGREKILSARATIVRHVQFQPCENYLGHSSHQTEIIFRRVIEFIHGLPPPQDKPELLHDNPNLHFKSSKHQNFAFASHQYVIRWPSIKKQSRLNFLAMCSR
uniref:Uncharacterized protein n=1 Tax=Romanomermis culicivorax TaxID=13658 RepID=A0A915J162_ROMCU